MKNTRPLAGLATAMSMIVVLSATLSAQTPRETLITITLQDARERARAIHPASVAARGDVDVAAWQRRSALTDLITPNVSAQSTYSTFSDPFINPGTGSISAQ